MLLFSEKLFKEFSDALNKIFNEGDQTVNRGDILLLYGLCGILGESSVFSVVNDESAELCRVTG